VQATDERRAELFVTAHSSAAPAPDRFVADENFRQACPALKSYPSLTSPNSSAVRESVDTCAQHVGLLACQEKHFSLLRKKGRLKFYFTDHRCLACSSRDNGDV